MTQPTITTDLTKIKKIECLTCYGKGYDRKIFGLRGIILTGFKDKKDQFKCPNCHKGQIPQWIDYKAGECERCKGKGGYNCQCQCHSIRQVLIYHTVTEKCCKDADNCHRGYGELFTCKLCKGTGKTHFIENKEKEYCLECEQIIKLYEKHKGKSIKLLPIKTDKEKERMLVVIR